MGPEQIQIGVTGGAVTVGHGPDPHAPATQPDGVLRLGQRPGGIVERDDPNAEHPRVVGAELGHGSVVGPGSGVLDVDVVDVQELGH
jgi:hypothetical protein